MRVYGLVMNSWLKTISFETAHIKIYIASMIQIKGIFMLRKVMKRCGFMLTNQIGVYVLQICNLFGSSEHHNLDARVL